MKYAIDKNSPLPRYFQLLDSLKQRIQDGEFHSGQPLPPERQLSGEYGVSRITVVKAMDELKKAGIVESQHGRGTFVKSPSAREHGPQTPHQYFFETGDDRHWKLVEKAWLSSPQSVVDAFDLSSNELQLRTTVLLSVAGEPTAVFMAHIPRHIAIRRELETHSDARLLGLLRMNRLVSGNSSLQSIEAIGANKTITNLLGVRAGKPMLAMDSIHLDAENRIEQYTRTVFRGDRFRLQYQEGLGHE